MNIRVYTKEDKNACLEIFKSNQPKYFSDDELRDFSKWLDKKSDNRYFVLEENDEVIGCGGYFTEEKNSGGLTWGMILSEKQGKGYGKILTEFRLKKLEEDPSVKKMRLNTCQHTYEFYKKLGFKVTQILKDGYSKGLDRYDMVKDKN